MKRWSKKAVLGAFLIGIAGAAAVSPAENAIRAEAAAVDFLVPDSQSRYLTEEDLAGMNAQVACYAKNEIYARHGRTFASQELQEYFEDQSWYYGYISPSSFSDAVFNGYETANIQLLTDWEYSLAANGYQLDQPGYSFTDVYDYLYGISVVDEALFEENWEESYVAPESNSRYLTQSEVEEMTLQELCYAKNEIYARRGRLFQSQELQDYFNSKTWYYGYISPSSFSDTVFNAYESSNIQLLKDEEFKRSANGYQLDQPGYDIYAVGEGVSDVSTQYIFPDSDSRYLTDEEVANLSARTLCYAKNEIYARRGRQFESQELQDFFNAKSWYNGTISPSAFSPSVFNQYETANIELLKSYEYAKEPGGYQLY